MIKNILVAILIILIFLSLGTIGYLIYSQKGGDVGSLTKVFSQVSIPKINLSFPSSSTTVSTTEPSPKSFPLSESTTTTNNNQTKSIILDNLKLASLETLANKNGQATVFIDKSNGNIYSLDSQNNNTRLTNTTITGVNEAYFGFTGNSLAIIVRQYKDKKINNFIGQFSLATSSESSELKLLPWPINLINLALSPNKQKVVYLADQGNGNSGLYLSDFSFKKPKSIWTSQLHDWSIAWPKDDLVTITSKASAGYSGSLYFLDLKTNKTTRILNGVNGLTVSTAPDGQKLLYSKSLLGTYSLYLYDVTTKSSRLVELNTLPEKCLWADTNIVYCAVPRSISKANYPDDWYLGKVDFTDDLWQIDFKQKTTILVSKLKGERDLINLTLNKQNGWLYAQDRRDGTLQAFTLNP